VFVCALWHISKDIYINNLEESTERTADGSSGIIIEIRVGGLLAYFDMVAGDVKRRKDLF
jgi:hypothetical protein